MGKRRKKKNNRNNRPKQIHTVPNTDLKENVNETTTSSQKDEASTLNTKKAKRVKKPKKQLSDTQKSLLTIGKFIATMFIFYFVGFGLMTFCTHLELKTHGYESSQEVVEEYLTSIITNKPYKIKKALYADSTEYLKTLTENRQYADILDEMNPTIDIANMEIETYPYDGIDIIQENIISDKTISNAYTNIVNIPYEETIDGDRFIGMIQYYVVSYEIEGKWYAYNFRQNDIMTILASDNTYNVFVDDTLGNISLNLNWVEADIEPLEGAVKYAAFISPNSNAIISLQAIESELTLDNYVTNFTNTLDSYGAVYSVEPVMINARPMQYIYYTTTDANNNIIHQCTWLFEEPMRDGYIHCLTLDANNSGSYAKSYIDSYVY